MSNYRRLISYIYAYEGGIKGKNIGYAKLEVRNSQCKINVSVKKVYMGTNDIGVYLLSPDKEILLGTIFIRGGNGEFRAVLPSTNIENSGSSIEQCYGLTIHDVESDWQCYTTIWEDAVAHAAEIDLADATAEKQREKLLEKERQKQEMEKQEQMKRETETETETETDPEVQGQETKIVEIWKSETLVSAEERPPETHTEIPQEPASQYSRAGWMPEKPSQQKRLGSMEWMEDHERRMKIREEEEKSLVPVEKQETNLEKQEDNPRETIEAEQVSGEGEKTVKETALAQGAGLEPEQESKQIAVKPVIITAQEPEKLPEPGDPEELAVLERLEQEEMDYRNVWNQMQSRYTKIMAFDYDNGCEILSIKPQDIGLLPREIWVFGNNSFLLHGYYNYRHLILAKLNNPKGNPRYLLGVPGHYYSNEKYMASMFGFPHFVLAKRQQQGDDRFGYWYTDIRL